MIRWRDDDIGLRVGHLDAPTDVGDAGRRISAARFLQDMINGHIGQLLVNQVGVAFVGDNPNVLYRADAAETV